VEELEPFALELGSIPERERARIHGIGERRAPTVVAGATLLTRLLKLSGTRSVVPCDRALREGLVIDYLEKNGERLRELDEHRTPRERSVFELAHRSRYDRPHALHVARLARDLFDQLRGVHGLPARDRELVEHAATLHDIGQSIAFERHHEHGCYLIRNGDLRGFEPEEVEILALVARYHRKRGPDGKGDPSFAGLSRRAQKRVVGLAALVRIADALDRSHFQVIDRVSASVSGREVRIRTTAHGDAELELWAARSKACVFEDAYDVRVRFEVDARPARAARQDPGFKASSAAP
jgi:exopolyphosphatase/guanosine-5'-triphosphate,3'-diphosphate pyrophosphatase